jgi:hypothetical protein
MTDVHAHETLFFGAEMELGEERAIFEGGDGDALPKCSDGLGNVTDALLVFRGKEKRAQERTMDAIAKGKPGGAKSREELIGESLGTAEDRQEHSAPVFAGLGEYRG